MSADRPRPLVAGNWKMNGLRRARPGACDVAAGYTPGLKAKVDLLVCPPATLIHAFAPQRASARASPSAGRIAMPRRPAPSPATSRPRCWPTPARPHVIVGHSERRAYHARPTREVRAKAEAARRAGLTAIVCVGETREEREAGQRSMSSRAQLAARCRTRRSEPRSRDRLRAGLGDRHRPHADARPTSPRCMPSSGRSSRHSSARRGGPGPHPLRRLGEARERDGADGRRERRRRAGRRREPEAADFLGIAGAYLAVRRKALARAAV